MLRPYWQEWDRSAEKVESWRVYRRWAVPAGVLTVAALVLRLTVFRHGPEWGRRVSGALLTTSVVTSVVGGLRVRQIYRDWLSRRDETTG